MEKEQGGKPLTTNFHLLGYHHGHRSPLADPNLKGMTSGLTLNQNRCTLALHYLSAIQSVAYGARHIMEAMNQKGHKLTKVSMCGGLTKNPLILREHANAMGCEITLPKEPEAVLLGGAILAASASNYYSNISVAMQNMCQVGATIKPDPKTKAFHNAKYKVHHEQYKD